MSKEELRSFISALGSFVSIPEAFEGADPGVKLAPKIEVRTGRFEDSKHALKIEPFVVPHALLVDLEAVDATALDPQKIIRDCELIIEAAKKHPEQLKKIVASFAADAPHERILEAAEMADRMELSEGHMLRKGGGLIFLLIIVAAIALSGCKGCAHTKGAMRQ